MSWLKGRCCEWFSIFKLCLFGTAAALVAILPGLVYGMLCREINGAGWITIFCCRQQKSQGEGGWGGRRVEVSLQISSCPLPATLHCMSLFLQSWPARTICFSKGFSFVLFVSYSLWIRANKKFQTPPNLLSSLPPQLRNCWVFSVSRPTSCCFAMEALWSEKLLRLPAHFENFWFFCQSQSR